jgi:hypothetical protein
LSPCMFESRGQISQLPKSARTTFESIQTDSRHSHRNIHDQRLTDVHEKLISDAIA